MTDQTRTTDLAMPEEAPLERPGEEPIPSPLAAAHRVLRGRYKWAIGLALVLAGIGAVGGYCVPRLTYTCTGMIEVAPKVPRIVFHTDENGVMEMFDSFVDSQAQLASSRRVIDLAMQSPEWMRFGRGLSDAAIGKFMRSLYVNRASRGQFVVVGFTDEDPEAATTAVNQLIKAYMKLVDERENESGLSMIAKLESQRTSLNSKLKLLERDVLSVSDGLGEEGLQERYLYALGEVNKFDAAINEIDLEIAKLSGSAAGAPESVMTDEQIALEDQGMARLIAQKEELELRTTELAEDGIGPNHQAMIDTRKQIAGVERRMAERALKFRASRVGTPDARAQALAQKKEKRAAVVALAEAAQADVKRLADKKASLLAIAQDRRLHTETLEDVKRRLNEINVESEVHGRISVMSAGDRPLGPDTDKRRSLAAMGGFGGIVLGFGIVLLTGIRDARLRHIGDVDDRPRVGGGRFLGILPEVSDEPGREGGENQAEMADFCVHHVRTMLQLRARGRPLIVAVTSPSPGDGKTTLALALGMSFAATGSRTLVVDCDFIGHGVTSAMRSLVCAAASKAMLAPGGEDGASDSATGVRAARVGDLLNARRMRFDDAQIAELLDAARKMAGRGDSALDGTVRALEGLSRSETGGPIGPASRGVLGALAGAPLKDCTLDVGIPNLSLLPVGDASAEHAESLSPQAINLLFASCRERYDTIIVDSGPVRGSLEAALTAAAADSVLMVVSRGGKATLLQEGIERLERVGATLAGVVFNRALADDVAKSSYASRSASIRDVQVE